MLLSRAAEQRQLHGGPLPLSPGATLSWLGFSEEGLLAAYDSEGELRLRSGDFGGAWVTAFSAAIGTDRPTGEPCFGCCRGWLAACPALRLFGAPHPGNRISTVPTLCPQRSCLPVLPAPSRAQEHRAVLGSGPGGQRDAVHRVRQQPGASGALG